MSEVVAPSELWKAARATWPGFALDEAGFQKYLKARPGRGTQLEYAADLYLCAACLAGERAALEAFDRTHVTVLSQQLARRGIAPSLAEETVQRLRVTLIVGEQGALPKLNDYDGRGPLAAWVRVAATRAASNLRRDEDHREALIEQQVESPPSVIDPELALVQRRYGAVFETAVHDALAVLSPEERNALRLTYTHGLNLEGVAKVLGVSRATAGRRLLECRGQVREETLRLLKERIEATPEELESLLGVVRSKLEVSLGALSSW